MDFPHHPVFKESGTFEEKYPVIRAKGKGGGEMAQYSVSAPWRGVTSLYLLVTP